MRCFNRKKVKDNDFLAFLKRKTNISTRGNSRITERAPIPTRRAPGQPEPRTLHADVHEGGQRADDGSQQGQQHQQVAVQERSSRAAEPPFVHGVQRQDADPPAGSETTDVGGRTAGTRGTDRCRNRPAPLRDTREANGGGPERPAGPEHRAAAHTTAAMHRGAVRETAGRAAPRDGPALTTAA